MIEQFGAYAITGNPVLRGGFVRRSKLARLIVDGYNSRRKSNNWAAWGSDNPQISALLVEAQRLANERY